jgi:hypothetical protein
MVQHYRLCKHYAGYEHHHSKGTEKSTTNMWLVYVHKRKKQSTYTFAPPAAAENLFVSYVFYINVINNFGVIFFNC